MEQTKAVNLLQIALPITGQWVTDNESIKIFMLYNQILRLTIGLWGWKKLTQGRLNCHRSLEKFWREVWGVVQVLLLKLLMRREQAEMVGISKYKCTVFYRKKINPTNYLQNLNYIVDYIDWKLNRLEKSSSLVKRCFYLYQAVRFSQSVRPCQLMTIIKVCHHTTYILPSMTK